VTTVSSAARSRMLPNFGSNRLSPLRPQRILWCPTPFAILPAVGQLDAERIGVMKKKRLDRLSAGLMSADMHVNRAHDFRPSLAAIRNV
jgi:hypothetical protein